MSFPVTLALVGAGNRGASYAALAAATGRGRIVAVAEPRRHQRERSAAEHAIPAERVFDDWRILADRPKLADAVIIATQDKLHVEPAVAFAERGYQILLEKPMAPSEAECERIVEAVERADVMLAVCHVLRYAPSTRMLRQILDSGRVGEVVGVEHLEPVGWWHHAHSYVRGNWRREDQSTFMLMAKSCHDLDWLGYIIGRRPRRVSSFGGLYHFRPENRPAGAADRCLDCPVEPACPYSAKRLYLSALGNPDRQRWPLSVITDDLTEAGVLQALREGPFGRCVYACDNDVVDHQVVNLEYEGGVTASFTMTAFTDFEHRKSRIFGTHGCIDSDGVRLTVHDFRTNTKDVIDTGTTSGASAAEAHGGADQALVEAFIDAVAARDSSLILSGPRESLDSHRVVWAAERARRTGAVVRLDQPDHHVGSDRGEAGSDGAGRDLGLTRSDA
jgi:predicted dehydrogenase